MNKNRNFIKKAHARALFIIVSLMTVLFFYAMAMGHGGKDHAAGEFTPLMALQEATKLYDRLVSGGKLKESWETGLEAVKISTRKKGGHKEFVVSFHRSKGEPNTVYIFLTEKGKYAGSNFTGK